jgi:hypothetical protein
MSEDVAHPRRENRHSPRRIYGLIDNSSYSIYNCTIDLLDEKYIG